MGGAACGAARCLFAVAAVVYDCRHMASPPTPAAARPRRPRSLLCHTALSLGVLGALLMLLVALGWQPLLELDRRVATGLHRPALAYPGWTRVLRILTDWVWSPTTVRLLLAAAALWLLVRGSWLAALWLAATTATSTAVQQGLKWALGRDRPEWSHPVDTAHYTALPSGHAMTAATGCVLLLWVLRAAGTSGPGWRLALGVGGVSVVGVSFTRVWLGVHWLTDTVTGVLLGTALALAAVAVWPRTRPAAGLHRQNDEPTGGNRA